MEESKSTTITGFRASLLCKAVACLLIFTFTATNVTYGYDKRDVNHLRSLYGPESGFVRGKVVRDCVDDSGEEGDVQRFKQLLLGRTPAVSEYRQAKPLWSLRPELTQYHADGATCELGHFIKWEMVIAREDGTSIVLGPDDVISLGFAKKEDVGRIQTGKRREISKYCRKLALLNKYQEAVLMDEETLESLSQLLPRLEQRGMIGDAQFNDIDTLYERLNSAFSAVDYHEDRLIQIQSTRFHLKALGLSRLGLTADERTVLNRLTKDRVDTVPTAQEASIVNSLYQRLLNIQYALRNAGVQWHGKAKVRVDVHDRMLKLTPDWHSGLRIASHYHDSIKQGLIATVADLGAGTSNFWGILGMYGLPNTGVIDIDNNPKMHQAAHNPNKHLCDITDMKAIIPDESCQLAASIFVFDLLKPSQLKAAFLESNRILKQGTNGDQIGELAMSLPPGYEFSPNCIAAAERLGMKLIHQEVAHNSLDEKRIQALRKSLDPSIADKVIETLQRLVSKRYCIYIFKKTSNIIPKQAKRVSQRQFTIISHVRKRKKGEGIPEGLNTNYIVASYFAQGLTARDIVVTKENLVSKVALREGYSGNLDGDLRRLEIYRPLLRLNKRDTQRFTTFLDTWRDSTTMLVDEREYRWAISQWNRLRSSRFSQAQLNRFPPFRDWHRRGGINESMKVTEEIEGERGKRGKVRFATLEKLRTSYIQKTGATAQQLEDTSSPLTHKLFSLYAANPQDPFITGLMYKYCNNQMLDGDELARLRETPEPEKPNTLACNRLMRIWDIVKEYRLQNNGRTPNLTEVAREMPEFKGTTSHVGSLRNWLTPKNISPESLGIKLKGRVDVETRIQEIKAVVARLVEQKRRSPNIAEVAREMPEFKDAIKPATSLRGWLSNNNVLLKSLGILVGRVDAETRIQEIKAIVARLTEQTGRSPNLTEVAREMPEFKDAINPIGSLNTWLRSNHISRESLSIKTAYSVDKEARLQEIKAIVARLKNKLRRNPNLNEVAREIPEFKDAAEPRTSLGNWLNGNEISSESLGIAKGRGRLQNKRDNPEAPADPAPKPRHGDSRNEGGMATLEILEDWASRGEIDKIAAHAKRDVVVAPDEIQDIDFKNIRKILTDIQYREFIRRLKDRCPDSEILRRAEELREVAAERRDRAIYRPESIEKARQALNAYLMSRPDSLLPKSVDALPLSSIYWLARLLELEKISEEDLRTCKLRGIERPTPVREKRKPILRVPTAHEKAIIAKAQTAVSDYCTAKGLPCSNFSNRIVLSDEPLDVRTSFWLRAATVFNSGKEADMLLDIAHEGAHIIWEGFPIYWLDEGMTEYVAFMAVSESCAGVLSTIEADTAPHCSIDKVYINGPASQFAFDRLMATPEGGWAPMYLCPVSLVEYLLNNIVPAFGGTPQDFIRAYMECDWDYVIELFGEEAIIIFEVLDEKIQLVLSEAPFSNEWLGHMMFAKAILQMLEDAGRDSQARQDNTPGPKARFGDSGNEADWKFIDAQGLINQGDFAEAKRLVLEAIDLLAEKDVDGYPRHPLNQTEVAIWVLRQLAERGLANERMRAMLQEFTKGQEDVAGSGPPTADSGERLIRGVSGDRPFKTYYIVADPLFSLLAGYEEEPEEDIAISIPDPENPRYLDVVPIIPYIYVAASLNLDGARELLRLVRRGNAIFFRASFILNPESMLDKDPNSPSWDRTKKEVVMSHMWHESLHLALFDTLDVADSKIWKEINIAICQSENTVIRGASEIIEEEQGCKKGTWLNSCETIAYIFTTLRDSNRVEAIIDEVFSTEVAAILKPLWETARPSNRTVERLMNEAQQVHVRADRPSYISIVGAITERAIEELLRGIPRPKPPFPGPRPKFGDFAEGGMATLKILEDWAKHGEIDKIAAHAHRHVVSMPAEIQEIDLANIRRILTDEQHEEFIRRLTQRFAQEDIDMLLRLMEGKYINPKFFEGIHLHIQLDKERIPKGSTVYEVIKTWLDLVKERSKGKISGKIVLNGNEENGLIKIRALKGRLEIGHCSVDVGGSIDTIPRIVGLLNIAFAGSIIPTDIEEYMSSLADYIRLVDYINDHHRLLTGSDYFKEDKYNKLRDGRIDEDIRKRLRMIHIDLPPIQRIEYDKPIVIETLRAV